MPAANDRDKARAAALKALRKIMENEQEPVADRIRAADLILKATQPTRPSHTPWLHAQYQQQTGANG